MEQQNGTFALRLFHAKRKWNYLVINNLIDVYTAMLEEGEHDHSKLTRDSGGYGITSDVKEQIKDLWAIRFKAARNS